MQTCTPPPALTEGPDDGQLLAHCTPLLATVGAPLLAMYDATAEHPNVGLTAA
jgi:hypothetical protein